MNALRAKKHLKKQAKELGLELESINFKKEKKKETPNLSSDKRRQSSSDTLVRRKSRRVSRLESHLKSSERVTHNSRF